MTTSSNCTPSSPTTFLFAYSNDLEPQVVLDVFKSFNKFSSTNFPYLGSIRFDSTVEDEIHFDLNFEDWNRTIYENLPDPKQSFEDAGTGSDVLKVIDKFLYNSRYPVCGSRILVLLKRYPNESDTNFLTGQLMQYHSYISVITSITPSGGLSFSTMYKLTSQTNGFGVFSYDEDFGKTISFVPTVYSSYLVYAFDVELSSTGKKYLQLPKMYLPYNNDYWLAMTIQDHGPLDSFQNMTLHWDGDALYKTKEQVLKLFGNSNHVNSWAQFDGGDYSLELQINYSDQKRELIQIRFYSPVPIDYWIPYN
ncbi:hypothetical protein CAEBREN_25464 [Caenorhabditis brenneri]|uniref:DUF7154 domain-containing protein n=1 Tax=Caenorhabditis brenneri TaxID=135651 RepID=G0NCS4_CAEBE|nr:hypothetical protein CAEBREN_25464 [Caenorhabditis brenneri]